MDPLYLNNPSLVELDDAYRGLPNLDIVHIKTTNLESTISDMEQVGFVAILVLTFAQNTQSFTIYASKGKHGPCHYAGSCAEYTGKALAALDDDNHLFIKGLPKPVCDKTARILKLEVFQGLISPIVGATELEVSDDDFEQSQEELFHKLENINSESERRHFFYPGPFRLLVLHDGTIVRRGKMTDVPLNMAKELIKYDGLKEWETAGKEQSAIFQEVYMDDGPACLMHALKLEALPDQNYETDFEKLKSIGRSLKHRLINLIKQERKYFVLIGNEADDEYGCCPSEEVSEANSLVRSGILESLSENVHSDACPVTLYAFKNELSPTETGFTSSINHDFRQEVYQELIQSGKSTIQLLVKWMLLTFVAVSLVFAGRQYFQVSSESDQISLEEALAIPENSGVRVVLFHNKKRRFQCERMERFTQDILKNSFAEEMAKKRLGFTKLVIDDPSNFAVVEQLGIFASTIVLVRFENMAITETRTLYEAAKVYQDEVAFKALMEREIEQFIGSAHE